MTRKSKRELERAIEELLPDDSTDGYEPPELTEEEREQLDAVFHDPDDLGEPETTHLENIREWLAEEREQGVESAELTPAETAWYALLLDDDHGPVALPQPYYERFPDAPRAAVGGA